MQRQRAQMQLVVNGDDFGISPEVNRAIIEAFRAGGLSSCSLMVSGEAFAQAVELAHAHPGLAVGIHLVTVKGRSVLPRAAIPTLVDQRGFFPDSPTRAGLRYYFSPRARRELFLELEAQFDRFMATGLRPSHVDSHLHMHVHPVVFRAAVALAERYGAPYMRVPVDTLWPALRHDARDPLGKLVGAAVFRLLTRPMKAALRHRRIAFTERVFGHLLSGRMNRDYVLALLRQARWASAEIYFHPATPSARLGAQPCSGTRELEILTDPEIVQMLHRHPIELVRPDALDPQR